MTARKTNHNPKFRYLTKCSLCKRGTGFYTIASELRNNEELPKGVSIAPKYKDYILPYICGACAEKKMAGMRLEDKDEETVELG